MAGKGEGPAIGIDLGMTYSCVGVWQHDRGEIIANDQGNTERLIGDAAKNQVAINPINTVFVTHRIAASKAIRDVEVGHLLIGLRLLRSNFNKEQLQISFLQFLEENMQNLTVKINEEDGQFEVKWKDKDGNLSVSNVDKTNLHESLLQKISRACPDFAAAGIPSFGGFEFSTKTASNKADLLSATDFQIPDFVMQDPSESQNLVLQNAFHTPGANSQRLSIGMTPNTLRLPKPGEMLLSVRGSPLGVYNKDDNMEAIDEAEEG